MQHWILAYEEMCIRNPLLNVILFIDQLNLNNIETNLQLLTFAAEIEMIMKKILKNPPNN